MYLKHCSLVVCTLDLDFWVIQPLNVLLSFWLFESPKSQFAFVLEDLPVSLFLLHHSIGHRVDLLTIYLSAKSASLYSCPEHVVHIILERLAVVLQ